MISRVSLDSVSEGYGVRVWAVTYEIGPVRSYGGPEGDSAGGVRGVSSSTWWSDREGSVCPFTLEESGYGKCACVVWTEDPVDDNAGESPAAMEDELRGGGGKQRLSNVDLRADDGLVCI